MDRLLQHGPAASVYSCGTTTRGIGTADGHDLLDGLGCSSGELGLLHFEHGAKNYRGRGPRQANAQEKGVDEVSWKSVRKYPPFSISQIINTDRYVCLVGLERGVVRGMELAGLKMLCALGAECALWACAL